MERKQVVNGCNGGCCEAFTLPLTINDLQRMKAENDRISKEKASLPESEWYTIQWDRIITDSGRKMLPANPDEVEKLLDMLIFLGYQEVDPQFGKLVSDTWKWDELVEKLGGNIELAKQDLLHRTKGHVTFNEHEKLVAKVYTCKYFDTENKICLNYENRPDLCKAFGSGCEYKGCGYREQMWKEIDAQTENNRKALLSESDNITEAYCGAI